MTKEEFFGNSSVYIITEAKLKKIEGQDEEQDKIEQKLIKIAEIKLIAKVSFFIVLDQIKLNISIFLSLHLNQSNFFFEKN
jgi:hypothetical protein